MPSKACGVMMANHRHKIDHEDDAEADKQHTLSDDWLSEDELLDRRAAKNKKRELSHFNKPSSKVRNEREKTKFPAATTVAETESVPESANNAPHPESVDSGSESEHKSTEGPTASLGLNPRKRTQRKVMNIRHSSVKSYFSSVDRTRELQVEKKLTQMHALMAWLTSTIDPEEGCLDTSVPPFCLRA